jgi:ADP-ribose pyrophosphatase
MKSLGYVYRGKKISVKVEECRMPSGARIVNEIVEHIGSVAVLPLLDKKTIVLLRQYRPIAEDWIYEIPAGTLEPGENSYECARRELEEETGYKPGKLTKLFETYLAPGYSTENLHSFVATDLQLGMINPSESEEIEVVRKPLHEAIKMIKTNNIRDAKTIATFLYCLRFGPVKE